MRKLQPARSRPEENVCRCRGLPAEIHYRCNRTNRSASAFVPPHTAKQERQRSAEYSNDVQNILQTEHPNRGEGADPKQRGQRHVEKIEDDQQEDTAKDNEGNEGL